MRQIRATDVPGLDILNSELHDDAFDLDTLHFDQNTNVITIPVRTQSHSGPESLIESGVLFKVYEKDWKRSVLTIRNVKSWEALQDQGINCYSFFSWRWSNNVLEAECNETMVLKFRVDQLDVELSDIGFEGRARITRGPGGTELTSGTVYE
jgi:hypothetical protein